MQLENPYMDAGFTLVEIIIVVVILGIMASLAIPKVIGPSRKVELSEGMNTLTVVYAAQKSFAMDNNGNFATSIGQLGVDIPASNDFSAPILYNSRRWPVELQNASKGYSLWIGNEDSDIAGKILCFASAAICSNAGCNKGPLLGGYLCN